MNDTIWCFALPRGAGGAVASAAPLKPKARWQPKAAAKAKATGQGAAQGVPEHHEAQLPQRVLLKRTGVGACFIKLDDAGELTVAAEEVS